MIARLLRWNRLFTVLVAPLGVRVRTAACRFQRGKVLLIGAFVLAGLLIFPASTHAQRPGIEKNQLEQLSDENLRERLETVSLDQRQRTKYHLRREHSERVFSRSKATVQKQAGNNLTQVVPYGNQRRCQRISIPRSRLNGQKRPFAFHNQGSSAGYGYNTQLGLT